MNMKTERNHYGYARGSLPMPTSEGQGLSGQPEMGDVPKMTPMTPRLSELVAEANSLAYDIACVVLEVKGRITGENEPHPPRSNEVDSKGMTFAVVDTIRILHEVREELSYLINTRL